MKYIKHFTVKEWKKFNKPTQSDNSLQFRNHLTGNMEAYDYWTLQEILLSKYKVILTDHINKRGVGLMCPTPLKEKIKNLPSHLTDDNFKKGMKKFDGGMNQFNKAVQMFSSGLGDLGEASKGLNETHYKPRKKDSDNVNKLMGKGGSSTKIWGDKKTSKRKKSKRKPRDDREEWVKSSDKIWGKPKKFKL